MQVPAQKVKEEEKAITKAKELTRLEMEQMIKLTHSKMIRAYIDMLWLNFKFSLSNDHVVSTAINH